MLRTDFLLIGAGRAFYCFCQPTPEESQDYLLHCSSGCIHHKEKDEEVFGFSFYLLFPNFFTPKGTLKHYCEISGTFW